MFWKQSWLSNSWWAKYKLRRRELWMVAYYNLLMASFRICYKPHGSINKLFVETLNINTFNDFCGKTCYPYYRQGSQRDGETHCIIATELMLPKQKCFYRLKSKQLSRYLAAAVVFLPSSYISGDMLTLSNILGLFERKQKLSVKREIHSINQISN